MAATQSATALITGASSGIGRSLARLFARDGYSLVLVARRGSLLEDLAAELLRDYGVVVRVMPVDLTDPAAAMRLFTELQRTSVTVDVQLGSESLQERLQTPNGVCSR
jgi:hypothetical protein